MYPMLMAGVSCTHFLRFYLVRRVLAASPVLFVASYFSLSSFSASIGSQSPHCRVCRSSRAFVSHPSIVVVTLRSLSRRSYLFISPVVVYLSHDVLLFCYLPASSDIHVCFAPASASVTLLSLFYYIAILLVAILDCCLDLTLLCWASMSPLLGGTYCHKPRVDALAHPIKPVT